MRLSRASPAALSDRLRLCLNLWPVNLYFVFTSLDKTSNWALLWGEGKHAVGEYRMPVIGSYFTARRRRGARLGLHENHSKPSTVVLMRTILTIQLQYSPENKNWGLSNGILILRLGCLFVSLASFHLSPAVKKWRVLKCTFSTMALSFQLWSADKKVILHLPSLFHRSREVLFANFLYAVYHLRICQSLQEPPIWQAFKYNTVARPTYIAG